MVTPQDPVRIEKNRWHFNIAGRIRHVIFCSNGPFIGGNQPRPPLTRRYARAPLVAWLTDLGIANLPLAQGSISRLTDALHVVFMRCFFPWQGDPAVTRHPSFRPSKLSASS